jgi:hypothetical protein
VYNAQPVTPIHVVFAVFVMAGLDPAIHVFGSSDARIAFGLRLTFPGTSLK